MDENARYSGYNLSISNSQHSSQKKEELSSKLHCCKNQNIFHKKDMNAAITDKASLYQNNKRIIADEHARYLEYIIFISNKNKILSGAIC
jgi:cytochrome c-type biogenesis protein CcmH/NrfF